MFLHIGSEVTILTKTIIGIFNLENKEHQEHNDTFLNIANDEGFIVTLTEKPNSFIVTEDKVFLSPISALTLRKRSKSFARK